MKQRKINIQKARNELIEIEDAGHEVIQFTDFHWRIDDKYDVWPSSKKFMKRDGYYNVLKYNNIKDIFN